MKTICKSLTYIWSLEILDQLDHMSQIIVLSITHTALPYVLAMLLGEWAIVLDCLAWKGRTRVPATGSSGPGCRTRRRCGARSDPSSRRRGRGTRRAGSGGSRRERVPVVLRNRFRLIDANGGGGGEGGVNNQKI
jgi:hypothetical protein